MYSRNTREDAGGYSRIGTKSKPRQSISGERYGGNGQDDPRIQPEYGTETIVGRFVKDAESTHLLVFTLGHAQLQSIECTAAGHWVFNGEGWVVC